MGGTSQEILASWQVEVTGGGGDTEDGGGRLLKSQPITEPYVRCELSVRVQSVVAGLHARCLPLQVELGRYTLPQNAS